MPGSDEERGTFYSIKESCAPHNYPNILANAVAVVDTIRVPESFEDHGMEVLVWELNLPVCR